MQTKGLRWDIPIIFPKSIRYRTEGFFARFKPDATSIPILNSLIWPLVSVSENWFYFEIGFGLYFSYKKRMRWIMSIDKHGIFAQTKTRLEMMTSIRVFFLQMNECSLSI